MKNNDIIKRAKKLSQRARQLKTDDRYKKVVGFLVAKGLLFDEKIALRPNVKLDVMDVLWVAEKVEPRVFEVFPAAFLHFPKTFLNTEAIPKALREIIDAIKHQRTFEQEYNGIKFKQMQMWANRSINDRRVKSINEKKVPKNFRLSPKAVEVLKGRAREASLTETALLEMIILKES